MIALIILGIRYMTFSTSEFVVTNQRISAKVGIISRLTLEILLTKVESIEVNETVFGRIFGYGTIYIKGSGGTATPFPEVANPFEVRRQINEQIEKIKTSNR